MYDEPWKFFVYTDMVWYWIQIPAEYKLSGSYPISGILPTAKYLKSGENLTLIDKPPFIQFQASWLYLFSCL